MDGRTPTHEVVARGGRPLHDGREAARTLSDRELERELTLAASAPGRKRLARYERLLRERQRRRLVRA